MEEGKNKKWNKRPRFKFDASDRDCNESGHSSNAPAVEGKVDYGRGKKEIDYYVLCEKYKETNRALSQKCGSLETRLRDVSKSLPINLFDSVEYEPLNLGKVYGLCTAASVLAIPLFSEGEYYTTVYSLYLHTQESMNVVVVLSCGLHPELCGRVVKIPSTSAIKVTDNFVTNMCHGLRIKWTKAQIKFYVKAFKESEFAKE